MTKSRIILPAVAVLVVVAIAAVAGPLARWTPQPSSGTAPPESDAARVLVYPTGGPEADAAWSEISATLARHGCQLEVHRRAQADGTERTVIIIQAVQHVISMP
jgi:MarR-like DNA-binding transcriptional regulator SgrR of sgrS sRNA